MSIPKVQSRSVLVTGCSSGIGAATADLLREAGWQVFPTARKPGDLDALRARGFAPIALDVAEAAISSSAGSRPRFALMKFMARQIRCR